MGSSTRATRPDEDVWALENGAARVREARRRRGLPEDPDRGPLPLGQALRAPGALAEAGATFDPQPGQVLPLFKACTVSGCDGSRRLLSREIPWGFYAPCPRCSAERQERLAAEAADLEARWLAAHPPWSRLGLSRRVEGWSLDRLVDLRVREHERGHRPPAREVDPAVLYIDCHALAEAVDWLYRFDPWEEGIGGSALLHGPVGVGKSRLAISWAQDRLAQAEKRSVFVFRHRDLWRLLMNTYGKAEEIDLLIRRLTRAQVVIWDDFAYVPQAHRSGGSAAAQRVAQVTDDVVDARCADERLTTIYTSNLTIEELGATIGEAATDRLMEATGPGRDGLRVWIDGLSWRR